MKGFSIALAGVLVSFFVIMAVLIPFISTKIHIEREIIFETKYTNAHLILLSILSSTETDTLDGKNKPVYEILAEYIAFNAKPNIDFLEQKLDRLVEGNRYNLFYEENGQAVTLKRSSQIPTAFTARTRIVLPYTPNRMYVELVLVID